MRKATSEGNRKAVQNSIPERLIQQAICQYLLVRGVPFSVTDASYGVKRTDQGVFVSKRKVSTVGWPDICACLPGGRFLGIEVKSAKGKVSPQQEIVHERITSKGGLIIVARSLDDVRDVVDRYF